MLMKLENVAGEVREKASHLGMSIVPGYFGSDKQPIFYNTYKEEISAVEFVTVAHQSGAKVLLLSVQVVTEDDLEDDGRDASKLNEVRKYLGRVCRIQMYAQLGGSDTFLEWEDYTEWAADFFGWNDHDEWDDDEDPEESGEEWEKAVEALANDAKFQAAKNTSQRTRAAATFFKANPDLEPDEGYSEYGLVREAFDHFEMEIKPVLDDKLAEEAQRLLDAGLNRSQVAKQLKITTDRLRKLV